MCKPGQRIIYCLAIIGLQKIHNFALFLVIFTAFSIFKLYDFYYESKRVLPLFDIMEQNFVDLEKIENMDDESR